MGWDGAITSVRTFIAPSATARCSTRSAAFTTGKSQNKARILSTLFCAIASSASAFSARPSAALDAVCNPTNCHRSRRDAVV